MNQNKPRPSAESNTTLIITCPCCKGKVLLFAQVERIKMTGQSMNRITPTLIQALKPEKVTA